MEDEVFQKYTKEMGIDIELIKLVNKKLKLPKERLSSFARPRRQETVKEAITWKRGSNQENRVVTKLYPIKEYAVAVGKPGKEAAPDYRRVKNYKTGNKTNNPNDMNPQILKDGRKHGKDMTFKDMFEPIEELKHSNPFALELLGMLLFRAAFMLDHKKNKEGNWRYSPPEEIMKFLEQRIPMVSDIPIRVFIHFLEILSLNEDVKVYTLERNPELKQDYGRVNTLLTFVHLIAVLLERSSISKFAGSFARPPTGMAALSKTKITQYFPLLS